jgi:flagellar motility protein MotE (MotC chaperone)
MALIDSIKVSKLKLTTYEQAAKQGMSIPVAKDGTETARFAASDIGGEIAAGIASASERVLEEVGSQAERLAGEARAHADSAAGSALNSAKRLVENLRQELDKAISDSSGFPDELASLEEEIEKLRKRLLTHAKNQSHVSPKEKLEWSGKQDKLEAGPNITIEKNVISATEWHYDDSGMIRRIAKLEREVKGIPGKIQGKDGVTPDITITATAGEEPVEVTKSGTAESPAFDFAFSKPQGSEWDVEELQSSEA